MKLSDVKDRKQFTTDRRRFRVPEMLSDVKDRKQFTTEYGVSSKMACYQMSKIESNSQRLDYQKTIVFCYQMSKIESNSQLSVQRLSEPKRYQMSKIESNSQL